MPTSNFQPIRLLDLGFSIEIHIFDDDQLASGSTLFAKTGHVMFSKRRVKMGLGMQKSKQEFGEFVSLVKYGS